MIEYFLNWHVFRRETSLLLKKRSTCFLPSWKELDLES